MRSRSSSSGGWSRCPAALVAALAAIAPAAAADPALPPAIVASFTTRVQPLLLNRCAAGACHGGPESHAPRFHRAAAGGQPDGVHTRANLAAFLAAVGPDRDPRRLAALLAAGHPSTRVPPSRRAAPLTGSERVTLDRWLAAVREVEWSEAIVDPAVVPAAAEVEVPRPEPPNRFRALLDAAANPPELPPPQEPQGLIFKNEVPRED